MPQPAPAQTLAQGLRRYYAANPDFLQNQDLWVGWIRIPWQDLQKHDIMHVVTGYGTNLADELRLIGFLLTAVTWRRPWYFYVQSLGVFVELWGRSLFGKSYGGQSLPPWTVCQLYWAGVCQGRQVRRKIDAYLDPVQVMTRSLASLRADYGIASAGAWDRVPSNAPPKTT